ncbi:MAG: DUF3568 domain-containing protein [Candidatus Omnitrophica bacterium]|nr:DUF3568 domain-containing protein [Candidatus Omnitrophota bacterium]MBU1925995.1 DUF3568 domain-containing protein [Candidatus Omnitrophota bacterium]
MNKHILKSGMAGLLLAVLLCGCASFLVGGSTAGTVVLGVDTMRIRRNVSYESAWQATLKTLKAQGEIMDVREDRSKIKAQVKMSNVEAEILRVSDGTVAVDIRCRKKGVPNLRLAEELLNEINANLSLTQTEAAQDKE